MNGTDRYGVDAGTPAGASGAGASDSSDEEVTEIRESIEQTRAGMSETIDELQERLSPAYLKEQVREEIREQYQQAKESVREATIGKVEDMVQHVSDSVYETRRSVVDTVTANPIPSALVGIGLAWLWMNRRGGGSRHRSWYPDDYEAQAGYEGSARRYTGDRAMRPGGQRGGARWDGDTSSVSDLARAAENEAGDISGQVQQTASRLAEKAKDTVTGIVDHAQETASSAVDRAQSQARRVEQRFNAALQDNPLALGAVALALGTALGAAMPGTRKEDEWMGEARDTLVEKAQSVASEAMDKVQEVAQTVAGDGSQSHAASAQNYQSGNV